MFLASHRLTERFVRERPGHGLRREKSFFGPLLALEGIFDAADRESVVLDRVNQRFERRGLPMVITRANQQGVTAGRDRLDSGLWNREFVGERLNFEIVAHDDAFEAKLLAQQSGDD